MEKPSQLYLSESSRRGSVPSQRSSPTTAVALVVQAGSKFWNDALTPVLINGHWVITDPCGRVAVHHRPSSSVVKLLGDPKRYSSGEVYCSATEINPSRLTSNPSSSGSSVISLLFNGSKYGQTYLSVILSNPPARAHMAASNPSGIPSPSVSDERGSRYIRSPFSSNKPVSPLEKPGSLQFAGYGQQYSSVLFKPSLSVSKLASEASSLSIPSIETNLPSTALKFTHSSKIISCTSGIPSPSVSVVGGF